jgi:beta-phosphoglucomutase-like phosphatase (HAD superfamily)
LLCDVDGLTHWDDWQWQAFAEARLAGLRLGLLAAANRPGRTALLLQLDEQVGPFDVIGTCPHSEKEACGCFQPTAGALRSAAAALLLAPSQCLVVGDTWAQLDAGEAAGATPVLIPSGRTQPSDIAASTLTRPTLSMAVALALDAPAARRLAAQLSTRSLEYALKCS